MGSRIVKKIEWLGLFGLILIFGGLLYPNISQKKYQTETIANTFKIEYYTKNNLLSLKKLKPISDQEALKLESSQVSITNLRDTPAMYVVGLKQDPNNTIDLSIVKVSYRKNGGEYNTPMYLSSLGKELQLIKNQKLESNTTDTYDFIIWISDSVKSEVKGKTFKAYISFEKVELTHDEAQDKIPPILVLNEPIELNLKQGDSFVEPGFSRIYDEQDGNMDTDNISVLYEYIENNNRKVVSFIDTNIAGTYYITYTLRDKASNETSVIRSVIIQPKEGEVTKPTLPEMNLTVQYSAITTTKDDVVVVITSNVLLKNISGWELSSDSKSLKKSFNTNVKLQLLVFGIEGQSRMINISISNIDKSEVVAPTPTLPPTPTPGMINLKAEFGIISTNSVELKAIPSDASTVKEYYYSCNGSWTGAMKENKFVCNNLTQNTAYTMQVKVIDKENRTILSSKISTKTLSLETPMFTSQPDASVWAKEKVIKITFPNKSGYTYQYKYLSDTSWITVIDSNIVELTLTTNKTIVARVTDGLNEVSSNYVETKIDTESPSVSNKNIEVTNVGLNSFTLSFNNAIDNSTPVGNLVYYVCKSTSNNLNISNCRSEYLMNNGGSKNISTYAVSGLTQGTTYYLSVVVVDQFGYDTFYNVKAQTTLMPTPIPTPTKTPKPTPVPVQQEIYDIADKSNLVGINYSIWFDYMQNVTGGKIYNIPDILNGSSSWGAVGSFHYWSKPSLGYYRSTNKSVIRQHMIWLADAGVDFIILDNTNVRVGMIGSDMFSSSSLFNQLSIAPTKVLLDTIVEMRKEGIRTPYVVNWMSTEDEWALTNLFQNAFYNDYDIGGLAALGYNKALYKNIFVHWRGLPFMLTTTDMSRVANDKNELNYRKMWGLQGSVAKGEWSYLQKNNNNNKGTNYNGNLEQMSVSVAAQQNRMSNTSSALGRRGGLTFYEQWVNAFNARPKYITLTWWNEWGAERISSDQAACTTYCFTDNYNQEYSRDIEPMSGGHGDKYYQRMKQYIYAYKNRQTIPRLVD